MNKYLILKEQLDTIGTGSMKCFGQSMMPILKSGSLLTFQKQDSYKIDDIVFCKVGGRFIDAHKVTKIGSDGRYMIANNRGYENGWTSTVYGRVISAKFGNEEKVFE